MIALSGNAYVLWRLKLESHTPRSYREERNILKNLGVVETGIK